MIMSGYFSKPIRDDNGESFVITQLHRIFWGLYLKNSLIYGTIVQNLMMHGIIITDML